ncbi:uncharacterized protein LOC115442645 [Manduca sexta]|uniref:Uncharacterized protein n=1 Tax=Manduca sexta TaxID=7130 RepID=A0A921Z0X9_MANSE|nr:uncharacterized protein LOC115442645 [Manduca sexta]KAG6448725.1 hypothetical protein O3G_MSEX005671 [Manduca sexta]
MNQKQRNTKMITTRKKARPIVGLNRLQENKNLQALRNITKTDSEETQEEYEANVSFKSQVERFIEISKYFSNPFRKTASYICENQLVTYPSSFRIEYKRGGITTEHIKFCNLTLEPVYVKLFKLIPDLEQLKFINLSLSRSNRIPPGLSFSLGFVYDDVNEKPSCNAKMIFVALRKTTTPCYQICEIDLLIDAQKNRLVTI